MERIRRFVHGHTQNLIRNLITSRFEEIPFVIFVSFFITFLVTRFYIQLTNKEGFAFLIDHIYIYGVHVHHLNFGIIILCIVGFWSLYNVNRQTHRTLAIFYGIGLALTFDEFALWLYLQDDYYARASYNAIMFVSALLLSIVYFPSFWRVMRKGILLTFRPVTKLLRFKSKK